MPSWSSVMNRKVGSTFGLTTVRSQPVPLTDRAPVARRWPRRADPRRSGRRRAAIARQVDDALEGGDVARRGSRTARCVRAERPLRTGSACTPARPAASSALARSWIHRVTSVSAGPPSGGLYLNPPSAGGLCDGVTTTPSAGGAGPAAVVRRGSRARSPGSACSPPRASHSTCTSFAASTSSAVTVRGLGERVGVGAEEQRPADALRVPVLADRLGGRDDVVLVERRA